MSNQPKRQAPYKSLGNQLKQLRQKLKKTMAEVSGAVEIDIETLSQYEQGSDRPSEEILMLLISHFDMKEDDAIKLWSLAGYTHTSDSYQSTRQSDFGMSDSGADEDNNIQQVMVMPMDARIVYTDMVHVSANDYGVVVNFMQGNAINGQPLAVSRLGMSREHARSLVHLLQKTLLASEPKGLPAPDSSSDD